MSEAIDLAKLQLDAYSTAAEVQAKLMEAYANFNYRMMEVLKLRVEIETDIFKLRLMQAAFYDYEQARRRALMRVKDLEAKSQKLATSVRQLNHLALAETTPATWVPFGWRSFWYLVSQGPVAAATEMALVKCNAKDRKGTNFIINKDPNIAVDDAPSNIDRALVLMDWSRKLSAVPRIGTPPYSRLTQLLEILSSHASPLLAETKKYLKDAEKDLERIRKINWRNLKIEEEAPKDT